MQVEGDAQFLVEVVRDPSGDLLAQEPLGDLRHLAEEARFQAVSRKVLPDEPDFLRASLEPIRPEDGGPSLGGIRIILRHRDPALASFIMDVPANFAAGRGSEMASVLVQSKVLKDGDLYRTRVALGPPAPSTRRSLFGDSPQAVEIHEEPFPVEAARLAAWGIGPRELAAADPYRPVFVSREIIERAKDDAVRHGEREVGSLLLGHLVEDGELSSPEGSPVWSVIYTAEVDVPDGQGTESSFNFSSASFRRARQLAALRGRGEEVLGSQHSHGYTTACPHSCTSGNIFFSAQDDRMARVFPIYATFFVVGCDPRRDQQRPSASCFLRWRGAMRPVRFAIFG